MGASGGNLGHVELYNNDKSGNFLYPYAINCAASSISQFTIENYQGQKATTIGATPFDYGPLILGGPLLAGVIGGFYSASCMGNHIGQGAAPQGGFHAQMDFPYAAVPPGYSFCLECQTAGDVVVCGIWWLVDGAP